jgi:hypothetical protein
VRVPQTRKGERVMPLFFIATRQVYIMFVIGCLTLLGYEQ